MNLEDAKPGTRVGWAEPEDELEANDKGLIIQPTEEDWDHFRQEDYPKNRCVLVAWNGDEWDTAWFEASELKPLEE